MHIYKKVLPVAVAMALAACGGGSDSVEDQSQGAQLLGTYPKFNPVTSELPLNTDLIFNGSVDGTANLGDANNPAEAAVNALDGFSPNAPFDIAFEGSIDPDSICTPIMAQMGAQCTPNVFLVPLDTGSSEALELTSIQGVDSEAVSSTLYSASAVSLDGGSNNVLRVTPLKPLLSSKKYLVFVTNGLLDSAGEPVQGSVAYHLLGESEPAVTGDLASVRLVVGVWETIATGVLLGGPPQDPVVANAAKDSIVISYTFTTSDPVTPLVANAAPSAAIVKAQVGTFGVDAVAAVQNLGALLQEGVSLSTPVPRVVDVPDSGVDLSVPTGLDANVGSMYTGTIELPYYLRTPETTVSGNYKLDSWQADKAIGASLLPKVKASLPQQVADQLPPVLPLPDADGTTFNVTYRYPFAEQASLETVPLQVTLPDAEYEVATGVTCSAANPDGLPVVMYVHGIGSDRTSVVALAHSLAKACVATVAIDLPLHGGRAFDGASSATNFINLAVLTNTRDNVRQGVMDLLNLNASLAAIDSELQSGGLVGLDVSNVKVVGASLGGVVGSVYATVNQLAYAADNALAQQVAGIDAGLAAMLQSKLNPLSGLAVSASGGQLTQLLRASATFGPVISAGLSAEGVVPGSSDFERFLYVAQSTVDSGDPVSFAESLAGAETCDAALAAAGDYPNIMTCGGLTVPVLMQQVVGGAELGDGQTYTADKVVPNAPEGFPLSGTTGLATLLRTTQLGASANPIPLSGNALINMTAGHHSSLLRPNEQEGVAPVQGEFLTTGEMQTQVVTFVASDAAAVSVGTAGGGQAAAVVQQPAP
ncbi:hypothetical protein Y5S_00295 [Alcanivorax nanhaiticus]|uniref:Bacterial virulence factor lipase N-terminal domain-containing protein n=1 Tax=Alcanivorax nanhaiticus TaxID=1177154 RepID=A0A095TWA9_9GAMM|nr:hypothetical protein [Alcanivorax nanhaiticus]KGD66628.1 hypothetical protein Y5S_00295 [Alcanivorax nanhaiticus]